MPFIAFSSLPVVTVKPGKPLARIYGPNEVPPNHPLYGQKLYRNGVYSRRLILFSKNVVEIIVFRFRLPGTNKSFSLLPFFISPFQRHINLTIETCLVMYLFERRSLAYIQNRLDLGLSTIKRWITRFRERLPDLDQQLEERLVCSQPSYRPASFPVYGLDELARSVFTKAFMLCKDKKLLKDYSVLSWLNLEFGA